MLIKIYPENPDERRIQQVIDVLKKGGVIVYPTDSVYSMGCDMANKRAVEKMAQLKGVKLEEVNFSLICYDLSNISEYTVQFGTDIYKMMKRALPGPYTFILNANKNIPKLFQSKKQTIGIRVPDNNIARTIVNQLGNPMLSTSVHDDDEILEYTTDPELIHERYDGQIDLVIDGGFGNNEASTVIDCTGETPEILRQGIGEVDF
ncbi:MAG: L-threonylcarbamoyladenylate synthase [Flavobacteriales bacterium]|nr:L-threonylcarbamoyladenylate synthase [Flavobacteriales bacterium]MCW8912736.1 L-threonylcarbamoyladenylate synthase [Flavobacteriales bacterium]MCW8936847.1 L-threonylcarbamoyladenylate synthase [Flavobacteriales bacterium]MCW8968096.1 L-threonylcarbamoyladenylate synthase [Flavobacteriales bacterium]MCW8989394.1 L-threonylcarbamoyladenylate synthase [Flavobacteriales bacterium]